MNLVIDIGNTQTKYALMDYGKITAQKTTQKLLPKNLDFFLSDFKIDHIIVSSVAKIEENLSAYLNSKAPSTFLNHNTKTNFINGYKTPETLGIDRIALAAAAESYFPNKNVLVIDAGTCITYDFKNDNKTYLGGAISPGIEMRLKALNHFTHGLPLVKMQNLDDFIGDTTQTNIISGVLNGIINEVDGVINQYRQRFDDLQIVITGGDQDFFARYLKNDFFARPYFLLNGLNAIAEINA